ncbi:hypothetical protein JCM11491_001273 [Sporobolomyces phaffii]
MIDALVQYLLEEIAMDGDEGTSFEDLATFVSDFYATRSSPSTSTSAPTHQVVDEAFLAFLWNSLVEQPDVRVGLLKNLDSPPRHADPEPDNVAEREPPKRDDGGSEDEKDVDNDDDDAADESGLQFPKRPAPKRSFAAPSTTPTHELTLVAPATAALGYAHLASVFGDQGQLRVVAAPATAWRAITGSHTRPKSITPMVYQVLQMASRGRGEGVTAVRLSRELGVDPKSVFHYIKVPHQLGIVEKISAIDQGSRTNRILHKRYLSVSRHWAIHSASEPHKLSQTEPGRDQGDERPSAAVPGQMSMITSLYLSTNPNLVRNRIVKALKQRGASATSETGIELEKCWMVHSEMASSIGLHSYSSGVLRRLNTLINALAQEGVVEKVAVTKKNRKLVGKGAAPKGQVENVSTVQAIRLLDPDKLSQDKRQSHEAIEDENDDDDDDDHSYALANKSMQRQVLDLLLEADTRGLTLNELYDALGRYTPRTIDTTLQRLGRQAVPHELFDYSTTSLAESVGRMKQTRWFSLGGYIAMRRERGVPDAKAEQKWDAAQREYAVRASTSVAASRSRDGERQPLSGATTRRAAVAAQWSTLDERRAWVQKFNTRDHVGKGLDGEGGQTKTNARKRNTSAKKKPTKGKQKATDQDHPDADTAVDSDASEPEPVKPRGRPRKNAPVPGKESWYQRKKRLDAERIAQGLEVEESYYARKKREDREDRAREAAGLPPLVREKYKRQKPVEPKVEEGDDDDVNDLVCFSLRPVASTYCARLLTHSLLHAQQATNNSTPGSTPAPNASESETRLRASTSEVPEDDVASLVPPPPPVSTAPKRKRGRPSKSAKLAEAAAAALELEQSQRDGHVPAPPGSSAPPAQPEKSGPDQGEPDSEPVEARPKKRTRFSVVASPAENNTGDVKTEGTVPAPAQPARRRGRSSGPPLVPGPELDGAPVRTPPAPPAPPTPASVSETPTNPRRKTRSKAVVEIPVRPGSRMAQLEKDNEISTVAAASNNGTPTAPATSDNESATVTATSNNEPAAQSKPRATTPPRQDHSPSASTGDAVAGPSQSQPSESSPLPSSLTPAASSQPPTSSQPRTRNGSRRTVTLKGNLTVITRQKEILDYTAAQGGIIDAVPRVGEYMRDWKLKTNPSAPAFAMDRHVVLSTLSTLVKREQLRKTSAVGPRGQRHDIYYFPTIALDSPEMTSFLDKTLHKEKSAHWDRLSKAEDLVIIDGATENVDAARSRKATAEAERGNGGAFAPPMIRPRPTEDSADVKDFFRRQPNIVGASYGVRRDPTSRARQLHKWLASFLYSGHPGEFLAHSDDKGHILTHSTFVSAMPLVVFTSIVPLPVESDELRQFLADPDHLFLPLSLVPADILAILHPSLNKRKAAVWSALSNLMTLNLLSPLVESGTGRERVYDPVPSHPQSATHWRFNTSAPVYAFAREEPPLVSVARLDSLEAVSEYWMAVHQLSVFDVPDLPLDDPATLRESGFPSPFTGAKSMGTRFRLKSTWKDGYYLFPDQRQFLSDLVHADPDLVDPDVHRTQDIEKWADALYAPAEVVLGYMQSVNRKARIALEVEMNRANSHKRRRVRKSEHAQAVAGEGADGDEWEDAPDEPSTAAAATALHRKVQEVAAQRQRDWTTIVDKFRADHAQPVLDSGIVGYLERRFIDPRRQIDAVQLLFELRQLLPDPSVAAASGDELLRTVVPHHLLRRARQAKDPYAVSRQPNIRKRVRAQPSKAAKAPPRPRAASLSSRAGDEARTSPQPIQYGDQNEFLSQPAQPRPDLAAGRRVRNFYTAEQDELLLDAIAVLKARARSIDGRMTFLVLERMFTGHKVSVLRNRSLVLLRKPEEQAYHDRLVDAWFSVYEERKARGDDDNLYDPNDQSMTDFDIASFIRCLRENVDKRALRLTRTVTKPVAPSLTLPASLVALDAGYTVKPLGSLKASSLWDVYWISVGIASADRDTSVARASIATKWTTPLETKSEVLQPGSEGEASLALERERSRIAAIIKMIISTSEETYTTELGSSVLKPVVHRLDPMVQQLKNASVIVSVSSEPGRRIPGRNFSFHDKFFDKLDSTRITLERLSDATRFEHELTTEQTLVRAPTQDDIDDHGAEDDDDPAFAPPTSVFPIIPTEGEIMALIDLVSEGKVELSIDTSTLSEKATRFDDFGTRQANDDDIECMVQIASTLSSRRPSRPSMNAPLPLPRTSLPLETTEDPVELERVKVDLLATLEEDGIDRDLVRTLVDLIEVAGVDGTTLSELCSRVPSVPRQTILSHLSTLVKPPRGVARSPLAVETGFSHPPVYVSPRFVSSYAIPRPAPRKVGRDGEGDKEGGPVVPVGAKWLEPCVWTGVDGVANKQVWARCTSFVRGLLAKRSGMTLEELREKSWLVPPGGTTTTLAATAAAVPILTTVELRVVLATLRDHGLVETVPSLTEVNGDDDEWERGQGETMIDWEHTRWRLRGCFWSVGGD